jgi:hypothetical protein
MPWKECHIMDERLWVPQARLNQISFLTIVVDNDIFPVGE